MKRTKTKNAGAGNAGLLLRNSRRAPVIRKTVLRAAPGLLAALGLLAGCSTPGMIASGGATAGIAVAQERGPSAAIDDNAIAAGINQRWLEYDWHIFRDVSTSVSEGRVMLTGKVARPQDELAAVKLTWEVAGVRQVYDEIQVGDDSSTIQFARDVLISTQMRTNMTFDSEIKSINYNVVTVDGVVHLFGIGQSQVEIDRVVRYARNLPYVRNVVTHVVLKDDPNRHAEAQKP